MCGGRWRLSGQEGQQDLGAQGKGGYRGSHNVEGGQRNKWRTRQVLQYMLHRALKNRSYKSADILYFSYSHRNPIKGSKTRD